MKKRVSVIIPVYNVEKFILKTVESVMNQDYKDVEIILVNDGSPDNSAQIIDELAKRDSRIICIHKENGGVSSARNAGLKIATGEYVTFIDGDDWVNTEDVVRLIKKIKDINIDLDMILTNYYICFESRSRKEENLENLIHNKRYNAKDLFNLVKYIGYHNIIYKTDLLKKNNFINVSVTQKSADHGIDIFAEKDDISYAIQCKCYSSNIGNAAVQQAHTGKSIYHKDIAVVLTNQYFTAQAKEEANMLGVKLWDRDKLQEMIKKF